MEGTTSGLITSQMAYFTSNLFNFYGDWFYIFLVGGFIYLLLLLGYRWFRSKLFK